MKDLVVAGRALLLDLAATLVFFALYALTGNIAISIIAGIALALGQIGWRLAHRDKPDALQWVSLLLVAGTGSASVFMHDPLFVMLKPTIVYLLVGCAMLQRGWMVRYMPARVMALMPDMVIAFGYVWAGLMFFSAILNLALAAGRNVLLWGAVMSMWGTASKLALFLAQYAIMRYVGRKRRIRNAVLPAPLAA